jgi:hypothetical protein
VPLLEVSGCRWPVDEVNGVHLFCDAPKPFGRSYCDCHHQRAHIRTVTLEDDL